MRFLAKIYNNTGFNRFKMGFLAGLDYLLLAQNENGGWPQYFPYKGGYKNNITFNDDAMIGVMQILKEVSELKFSFVDDLRINKSVKAIEKGLELILRTQIISGGKLTICAPNTTLQTYILQEQGLLNQLHFPLGKA